jgi:hypothetical protein
VAQVKQLARQPPDTHAPMQYSKQRINELLTSGVTPGSLVAGDVTTRPLASVAVCAHGTADVLIH